MSEVNPPLVLEGGSHDSDLLRQLWGDTYTAGIVAADHLEVTEQSTPALGVTVAAGRAFVEGDEASDQGVYYVSNDADHDVDLATADATNDRIDLIVARVLDSFYSGASDEWELQAVTGTPAASPSAPSAPSNSLILAEVTVPADAGGNPAITNSDIEDQRTQARSGGVVPGGVLGEGTDTGTDTISSPTGDRIAFSVTPPAGRRLRLSAEYSYHAAATAGGSLQLTLRVDDSTVREGVGPQTRSTSGTEYMAVNVWELVDSTGSEMDFAVRLANRGNDPALRGDVYPGRLVLEDLGPA